VPVFADDDVVQNCNPQAGAISIIRFVISISGGDGVALRRTLGNDGDDLKRHHYFAGLIAIPDQAPAAIARLTMHRLREARGKRAGAARWNRLNDDADGVHRAHAGARV